MFYYICGNIHGVEVFLHPSFDSWLQSLSAEDSGDGLDWWEACADIAALPMALETYGRNLGDPECHEVVSTRFDMGALRRTPPTSTTPYAVGPPVRWSIAQYEESTRRHAETRKRPATESNTRRGDTERASTERHG